ncbi:DUF6087 family protein [Kitasatospora sp. CM 4170]|uniref:DUF6087 family protein n=1 Tax=Kitasatospora aburaviensis TaxID=67265 RepID=A0ABW1F206_9ACTN|nr:DUF6087 family protein [Kitasatospora sp. CM 4170]WNM47048.1 DUF6087 family protein [Kitasatospora sp. CM 4170]
MSAEDEPLAEWYARRAGRRRAPGTRDAITLATGPRRGAHVHLDVPRLVVEWDGYVWRPVGVAANYAAAYALITRSGSGAGADAGADTDTDAEADAGADSKDDSEDGRAPGADSGARTGSAGAMPQGDTVPVVPVPREGTGRHRKPER